MISGVATEVLLASAALALYAYAGYPLLLWLIGLRRPALRRHPAPADWPAITVVIPVYNGADVIRATIDAVLALDYPVERRQVMVVSDASTDGTDALVAAYVARGVELVRLERRVGKTAAENAALGRSRGEIVVNTDAAIRLHPQAAKELVLALADPSVGAASGRDVSVGTAETNATLSESSYVGYEMWVRELETRLGGIVGASGSLYAIRRDLQVSLPPTVARDFAAVLVARERGYRAVSVPRAVCFVPRGRSLRQEYRRKVRTMTRGLETLWHKRRLLDPGRDGVFAWMLFSHKLCRWLVPWAGLTALGATVLLASGTSWAQWLLAGWAIGAGLALVGWWWPEDGAAPHVLAAPAYLAGAQVAALHAWWNVLRRTAAPTWEPTQRPGARGGAASSSFEPRPERKA